MPSEEMKKVDKNSLLNTDGICNCPNKYIVENHGNGYALYLGRCPHRHGYNIANISEMDMEMFDEVLNRLSLYSALEQANKVLKEENEKCKRLAYDIHEYLFNLPNRQRCSVWCDINKIMANWQPDKEGL